MKASVAGMAVAAVVAISGCSTAPQTFTDEDRAAILAAHDAMMAAELENDWQAMKEYWAPEVVFLPASAPAITGGDNYLSWVSSGGFVVTSLDVTVQEIRGEGSLAFLRAGYSETYTVPQMGEPIADTGKYLAIYERSEDAGWHLTRWIWNSDAE